MPVNKKTGKTDRRSLTAPEVLEFRIKQAEEQHAVEIRKGKQRARGSPDIGEPEASRLVPSPLIELAGLGGLNLDSGRSSAANTSANNPATLPQPPLPEHPAPAPSAAPKTSRASQRSESQSGSRSPVTALIQHLAGFAVEVSAASQFLQASRRQALRSLSDTSPASKDGSLAARIAAMERRQDTLEKRVRDINDRPKQLESL